MSAFKQYVIELF